MKKSFISLAIIFFAFAAYANEITESRTFAWDMSDLENVVQWEMEWSDFEAEQFIKLGDIPYDGNPQPSFEAILEATVTGPAGTMVRKYFRLRTCGNTPQSDGTTTYECSGYSNVVYSDFWIPANEFQVPVNFRVLAEQELLYELNEFKQILD